MTGPCACDMLPRGTTMDAFSEVPKAQNEASVDPRCALPPRALLGSYGSGSRARARNFTFRFVHYAIRYGDMAAVI
jgi:hypothetical protein